MILFISDSKKKKLNNFLKMKIATEFRAGCLLEVQEEMELERGN